MDEKQATLVAIAKLVEDALTLADQVGDTYLGVLLDTTFQYLTETGATGGA